MCVCACGCDVCVCVCGGGGLRARGVKSPHSTYPGSALQEGDLGHGVSLLHQYNMQLVYLSVWECVQGVHVFVCVCGGVRGCVCVCGMCVCVWVVVCINYVRCVCVCMCICVWYV